MWPKTLMSKRETTETRPSIPAEIKRRVLVEAGHRCAIPTCRHIHTEIHHIIPWRDCQEHEYENLIALCPNCHRRADQGEIDRKSLKLYKANLRFMHDKFSQLELDLLFEAYKCAPDKPTLWPSFMSILLGRILEAGYIQCLEQKGSTTVSGLNISPDHIYITPKGRDFIENIGMREF